MTRLEQSWYGHRWSDRALTLVLWPLSLLFAAITALRRSVYRHCLLPTARLPVPLIVVGNIAVGGTGKTPLTIALAQLLRQAGRRPGIICRGYGGSAQSSQAVGSGDAPRICGDEAVLLAQRSNCPVWIGRDRAAAARGLLQAHPDCDLLLCDDGLQHYALARDFEIAVIDAARGFGNGLQLPAGPLRELPRRLATVNAIVVNGNSPLALAVPAGVTAYRMTLQGKTFANLQDPAIQVGAAHFHGRSVHAVAAIGNPQRFFDHLRELGLTFTPHAYPDHHAFAAGEISFGDDVAIIMTGKDAVKCRLFAKNNHWVLQVDAVVAGDLVKQISQHLGEKS